MKLYKLLLAILIAFYQDSQATSAQIDAPIAEANQEQDPELAFYNSLISQSHNVPVLIDANNNLLPAPVVVDDKQTKECQADPAEDSVSGIIRSLCCKNVEERIKKIQQTVNDIDVIVHDIDTKLGCANVIAIGAADINPNGYMISAPGEYCLKEDVAFNPAVPGLSAIVINAPNVVLHLNNKTLSQGNSIANTNGILINGVDSVIIEGGSIENFISPLNTSSLVNTGITINANSSNIILRNINIINCYIGIRTSTVRGLLVTNLNVLRSGTIGFFPRGATDLLVDNCRFAEVSTAKDSAVGVFLSPPSANVLFNNCSFSNNISTVSGGLAVGAFVLTGGFPPAPPAVPALRNINFINCFANENIGVAEGEGFSITGVALFNLINCIAQRNVCIGPVAGLGGNPASGYSIANCNDAVIENCIAEGNNGTGTIVDGFRIRRCSRVVTKNCKALSNINTGLGDAAGFYTDIDSTTSTVQNVNQTFDSCVAANNTASTFPARRGVGFWFSEQVNGKIVNCISQNNNIGILVDDRPLALSSHNIIENNNIEGNSSSGIQDITADTNAYISNVARSNGAPGNNYVGTIFATPGTPILTWTIPGAPSAANNNGVVGFKWDNLDIRP